MSSTATESALAISVFAADELCTFSPASCSSILVVLLTGFTSDYNIEPNYGVAIFTLLASQMFGYGIGPFMFLKSIITLADWSVFIAGLMRSFCVFPTYIVFPNLVPTVNLFDALHRDKSVLSQKKRLRFFWIVFVAVFCWEYALTPSSFDRRKKY